MPEIKFSHHYPKLHGQQWGRLLRVDCLPQKELPQDLLDYDTITVSGDRYKFPFQNSMCLILTFQGDRYIPFTTIRRSTAQKFMWYKHMIDKIFDIVINEEKPEAVPQNLVL